MVILADEISKEPARLAAAIGDYAVTRLSIVPPSGSTAWYSGIAASLAGLRYCITAGEPLPKNLVDRFKQLLPRTRFVK